MVIHAQWQSNPIALRWGRWLDPDRHVPANPQGEMGSLTYATIKKRDCMGLNVSLEYCLLFFVLF